MAVAMPTALQKPTAHACMPRRLHTECLHTGCLHGDLHASVWLLPQQLQLDLHVGLAITNSMSEQAREEGEKAPLLSAKLHKSWIADVQLLPTEDLSQSDEGNAPALPRLLTASNEGSVRLWDLSKCCGGVPLELAQADDLHTGKPPAMFACSAAVCILLDPLCSTLC